MNICKPIVVNDPPHQQAECCEECERLRAENKDLWRRHAALLAKYITTDTSESKAEIERLRVENEALREVIKAAMNYVELSPTDYDIFPDQKEAFFKLRKLTQRAREIGALDES